MAYLFLISSHMILAVSEWAILIRNLGPTTLSNMNTTGNSSYPNQASAFENSSPSFCLGLGEIPSMNPNFFLAFKDVLTALSHRS